MALISREHGFLFIMAPRTACTAIGHGVLIPKFGAEWIPPETVTDANGVAVVRKKHTTLTQLLDYGVVSRDEADRLLTFTSVRNPFDALVSRMFRALQLKEEPREMLALPLLAASDRTLWKPGPAFAGRS